MPWVTVNVLGEVCWMSPSNPESLSICAVIAGGGPLPESPPPHSHRSGTSGGRIPFEAPRFHVLIPYRPAHDIGTCKYCGAAVKIIACIEDAAVLLRVLDCSCGLDSHRRFILRLHRAFGG